MTVRELIAELSKYAEANPEVVITWESTFSSIDADDLYISKPGLDVSMPASVLLIDADCCFYKERFALVEKCQPSQ